jgi:hypothetical protein
MVCELELKYGVNYTEAFAFKQLARYVHYETLDAYEQHSPRILGVTQIANPPYATIIAIASQPTLQATITHHGTVPNNPNMVPTSINLFPQQLITATANIPPHQCTSFYGSNGRILLNFRVRIFGQKF